METEAPVNALETTGTATTLNEKMLEADPTADPGGTGASPKLLNTTKNNNVKDATTTTQKSGPKDALYFFEDEIFRIDKKGNVKFGIIIETNDSYSGDDDESYDEVLGDGDIRVAWYPGGKEIVQPEKSIGLADRTLMPGDVVRRLKDGHSSQRGYCRDINMYADVRILGTKHVIKNVAVERLRVINAWQRDSAVCLDSWVGSTRDVDENAVLRSLTTGTKIEIPSSNYSLFKEVFSEPCNGVFSPHYIFPGNLVHTRMSVLENVKILTPEKPLPKYKKGKTEKFEIESVETETVWVNWQCKALSKEPNAPNADLVQPTSCVTGEDLKRLKRLNLFESCMLQICDRSYLKFYKCDTIIKMTDWEKEQNAKFKEIYNQQQKQDKEHLYSSGLTSTLSHHFDKLKKRFSGHDSEKANKSKKGSMKTDKSNSSTNKEKNHNENSHNSGITKTSTASVASAAASKSCKHKATKCDSEWVSDDDADSDEQCDTLITDDTDVTTCSSSSPVLSPKHTHRRRMKRKCKSLKHDSITPRMPPKEGDELVVETILVSSKVTVVWQDGTIENNIPSTQLYPIHHLDTHEFFPGDFVIATKDSDFAFRDYGVIQTVDHHGRTARVKWFKTYSCTDDPIPTYMGECEVSVYDIKDHPDFQYRPGTMVIRVSNFIDDDINSTAGQIIDNYIEGRVKVWWVDGHISMCWPQDLFEVGNYNHSMWEQESEDSWETESVNSELGGDYSPKVTTTDSTIMINIDRSKTVIEHLEEIFKLSPTLQNMEVMDKLLKVYKTCRGLDRLLGTTFFDEENFSDLLIRVPNCHKDDDKIISPIPLVLTRQQTKNYYHTVVNVSSTQKSKNFFKYTASNTVSLTPIKSGDTCGGCCVTIENPKALKQKNTLLENVSPVPMKKIIEEEPTELEDEDNEHNENVNTDYKQIDNLDMTPTDTELYVPENAVSKIESEETAAIIASLQNRCELERKKEQENNDALPKPSIFLNKESNNADELAEVTDNDVALKGQKPKFHNFYNIEKNKLLATALTNLEKATSKISNETTVSLDDSGNFSRNDFGDGSIASFSSNSDFTNADASSSLTKPLDDQKSISSGSIEIMDYQIPETICVKFCSLLKQQLTKFLNRVQELYFLKEGERKTELILEEANDIDSIPCTDIVEMIKYKSENRDVSLNLESFEELVETNLEMQKELEGIDRTFTQKLASPYRENGDAPEIYAKIADLKVEQKTKTQVEAIADLKIEGKKIILHEQPKIVIPPEIEEQENENEFFEVLSCANKTHTYYKTQIQPFKPQLYYKTVYKEHRMLRSSMPAGVWLCAFEDRLDLLSFMIEGPKKTPYENCLFLFDLQLGKDYPKSPPVCHYLSYCTDRLNPNLYEDGKVCVSLLGTWTGRDTEVWGINSTLLQLIVSIQGLILVDEPYFNEAGYEKQKGTEQGRENSRMYNEMAIIKMVQSITKMLRKPPELFRKQIYEHYTQHGLALYNRIKSWMSYSNKSSDNVAEIAEITKVVLKKSKEQLDTANQRSIINSIELPEFPLLPASRGFCLTLSTQLEALKDQIENLISLDVNEFISPQPDTTAKPKTTICVLEDLPDIDGILYEEAGKN